MTDGIPIKVGDHSLQNDSDVTDEDIPNYPDGPIGVRKAYDDINEIFADVARQYPQFLEDENDEEAATTTRGVGGSGDQQRPIIDPTVKIAIDSKTVSHRPNTTEVAGKHPVAISLPTRAGSADSYVKETHIKGDPKHPATSQNHVESGAKKAEQSLQQKTKAKPLGSSSILMAHPPLRHDKFATEFIRMSGQELGPKIIANIKETSLKSHDYAVPQQDAQIVVRTDGIVRGTSMKLIYQPPLWLHQESLYRTLSRLPNIRSLILDDSKIKWLRELGSMLPNLKTLSVMRCGLESLDGASALTCLENLFAADNDITDPSPLATLETIQFVDLSDNFIKDLRRFAFLKACRSLTSMKLMENDVAKIPEFHQEMRRMIPSLRELRPRILEIHGPEVFDLYDENTEDEDEVVAPRGWSRTTLSSTGGDTTSQGESVQERSSWRDIERDLRNTHTPGRPGYKKKPIKLIPHTVDDMDALLDELETTCGSDPIQTDSTPPPTVTKEAEEFDETKLIVAKRMQPELKRNQSIPQAVPVVSASKRPDFQRVRIVSAPEQL